MIKLNTETKNRYKCIIQNIKIKHKMKDDTIQCYSNREDYCQGQYFFSIRLLFSHDP